MASMTEVVLVTAKAQSRDCYEALINKPTHIIPAVGPSKNS
jgi:hypothetical protein